MIPSTVSLALLMTHRLLIGRNATKPRSGQPVPSQVQERVQYSRVPAGRLGTWWTIATENYERSGLHDTPWMSGHGLLSGRPQVRVLPGARESAGRCGFQVAIALRSREGWTTRLPLGHSPLTGLVRAGRVDRRAGRLWVRHREGPRWRPWGSERSPRRRVVATHGHPAAALVTDPAFGGTVVHQPPAHSGTRLCLGWWSAGGPPSVVPG